MSSSNDSSADAAKKTRDVLQRFRFERVLGEDARTKVLSILGTVSPADPTDASAAPERAVISIEKLHFTEREVPELHARFDELRVTDSNDIYTWVNASLSQPTNARHKRAKVVEGEVGEPVQGGDEPDDMFSADVKIYLIYPATDLHIRKYTLQERVLIRETPELYQNVTLPYIRSIPEKRTAWVQNILDGVKEQDSVVLSDPDPSNGFVVVPDSKWDRLSVEALYLQVLCRNPAIGSLRDLRAEHIPLLKNIRKSVGAKVEELYQGVKREHLRMYIHYQPSYYRFHVHITHVRVSEGAGAFVGQAHLVEDVIENLAIDSEYYTKRTLIFGLGVETDLYAKFAASGSKFLNGHDE